MNYTKVIEIIKDLDARGYLTYREAKKLAIEACEKKIPMEHHHTVVRKCKLIDEDIRLSICLSCLGVILTSAEEFPKFCTWCGQAIDWEE